MRKDLARAALSMAHFMIFVEMEFGAIDLLRETHLRHPYDARLGALGGALSLGRFRLVWGN